MVSSAMNVFAATVMSPGLCELQMAGN